MIITIYIESLKRFVFDHHRKSIAKCSHILFHSFKYSLINYNTSFLSRLIGYSIHCINKLTNIHIIIKINIGMESSDVVYGISGVSDVDSREQHLHHSNSLTFDSLAIHSSSVDRHTFFCYNRKDKRKVCSTSCNASVASITEYTT